MNVINIMWAGGSPFVSVHKVHQQILSLAAPGTSVINWLLQGRALSDSAGSPSLEWNLSSRLIKGRHVWKLLGPWLRARFRKALLEADAGAVLLDGVGVARLLLPVLRSLPSVRVAVLFHGETRLSTADVSLLKSLPTSQMTLVAVSRTLADALQGTTGLPVTVLRSALEPSCFETALFAREQARQTLGVSTDGVRVMGAVGRLVASKGFDYLIDAFAQASRAHPDLRLFILGEGAERVNLEARVERLGLLGKVILPGHFSGCDQLYRAFDWVLIPSYSEGLGLVLQEAVLAGVPVLCSDLAVFREQLGEDGCYAPVGDTQAWAQAIERCAALPAVEVASAQYRALAPVQAWQTFSQTSRDLLAPVSASAGQ